MAVEADHFADSANKHASFATSGTFVLKHDGIVTAAIPEECVKRSPVLAGLLDDLAPDEMQLKLQCLQRMVAPRALHLWAAAVCERDLTGLSSDALAIIWQAARFLHDFSTCQATERTLRHRLEAILRGAPGSKRAAVTLQVALCCADSELLDAVASGVVLPLTDVADRTPLQRLPACLLGPLVRNLFVSESSQALMLGRGDVTEADLCALTLLPAAFQGLRRFKFVDLDLSPGAMVQVGMCLAHSTCVEALEMTGNPAFAACTYDDVAALLAAAPALRVLVLNDNLLADGALAAVLDAECAATLTTFCVHSAGTAPAASLGRGLERGLVARKPDLLLEFTDASGTSIVSTPETRRVGASPAQSGRSSPLHSPLGRRHRHSVAPFASWQ